MSTTGPTGSKTYARMLIQAVRNLKRRQDAAARAPSWAIERSPGPLRYTQPGRVRELVGPT